MYNKKGFLKLFLLSALLCAACSADDAKDIYIPKSEITKALIEKSGLIENVYSDQLTTICDGVQYTEIDFMLRAKRQRAFIAEVDLTKVTFTASTPNDENVLCRDGEDRIMPEHAAAAESHGKKVWLAVNGDFWGGTPLKPMGLFYKDGVALCPKIFSNENKDVIYMTRSGDVFIGYADEALKIKDQLWHAVGGKGRLVTNNEVDAALASMGNFATDLNPRTSAGLLPGNKKLILIAFDGRRQGYSLGISLLDLAQLMKAIGCETALNLDGGGSTTFVIRKEKEGGLTFPILNRPTDSAGPRKISNGILIIAKQ